MIENPYTMSVCGVNAIAYPIARRIGYFFVAGVPIMFGSARAETATKWRELSNCHSSAGFG